MLIDIQFNFRECLLTFSSNSENVCWNLVKIQGMPTDFWFKFRECLLRLSLNSGNSDNQFKLTECFKTTSPLVRQRQQALNDISAWHAVRLYWVPGHAGVRGNETADRLARSGSGQRFIGPEPFLGVYVISCSLNFICQHFRTLCLFHLHRQVGVKNDYI